MLLFSFFLNIFLCQGYELSGEIALKNNHYYYYYYYYSVVSSISGLMVVGYYKCINFYHTVAIIRQIMIYDLLVNFYKKQMYMLFLKYKKMKKSF